MPRQNPEEFWKEQEDWSRRKHGILEYYLKSAVGKLRSAGRDRRVVVLDAFAGRGEYQDGSPRSPKLLAKLADDCSRWDDPLNLKILNVEADSEAFAHLERVTKPWVDRGVVSNSSTEALHGRLRIRWYRSRRASVTA